MAVREYMSHADDCTEEQKVAITSEHVMRFLSPKTMLLVHNYLPMFNKGTSKGPLVPRKEPVCTTHDVRRRTPEEMNRLQSESL